MYQGCKRKPGETNRAEKKGRTPECPWPCAISFPTRRRSACASLRARRRAPLGGEGFARYAAAFVLAFLASRAFVVAYVMLVPSASDTRLAVRSSFVANDTRTWQLSRMALFGP